jgi:hypothetical protein
LANCSRNGAVGVRCLLGPQLRSANSAAEERDVHHAKSPDLLLCATYYTRRFCPGGMASGSLGTADF